MLLKNKIEKVKYLLKADNILTSTEECYCYSKDASNTIFESKTPDLIAFAETTEDVQKILSYANTHKIPIVPRGAGTNMVGACVPNKGGIVLNFSKMNKILEINPTNMIVTVQPGVVLGDLKKEVEKFGLFYPPDPSNYRVSTVGGSIAQSSGGAMSFKYGTTKDYVLSLKVVTADGSLLQLGSGMVKDSVGYHLSQLMVGSEGTLAIVVEATLKLIPKPESERLIAAYFSSVDNAINAVNSIVSVGIFPSAIEFMDKNSIGTVEDFLHCGLKTENECLILINIDGTASSMQEQINKVKQALLDSNSTDITIPNTQSEMDSIWRARRASFSAATRLAPDVVSDDIIVPRDKLSNMINKCNELSQKYNIKMCLVGHIGDGNLHPQFVLNLDNDEEYKRLCSIKAEMYEFAKDLGGTISAEHGVGLEKKHYLSSVLDKSVIEYMKLIKKVFDPNNILNPEKIFNV